MSEKYLSALVLDHTVFDCIEFQRKGFQNDNDLQINLQIKTGSDEGKEHYKVTLVLEGEKQGEYSLKISVSGFFHVEEDKLSEDMDTELLIKSNAVAILMPYLRGEVSLLTAQPETESVVMPVFNVNAMLADKDEK